MTDPDKFYREFVSTEEVPLLNPKKMFPLTGTERKAMERYAEDSLYKPGVSMNMVVVKADFDATYSADTSAVLLEVVGKMVLYKKNPLKDRIVQVPFGIGEVGSIVRDLVPNPCSQLIINKIGEAIDKLGDEDEYKAERMSNIIDVNFLNLALYMHARKVVTPGVTISCDVASRLGMLAWHLTGLSDSCNEVVGQTYTAAVHYLKCALQMYNPADERDTDTFTRILLGDF